MKLNFRTYTRRAIILWGTLFYYVGLLSQPLTQSLRGTLIDQESHLPIDSVRIHLTTSLDTYVWSDENGEFRIPHVPVGRQSLLLLHPEYEALKLPLIRVTSGKEVVIEAKMKAIVRTLKTVTISAQKEVAKDPLSQISRHSLNMETGKQFAGSLGDPSRMLVRFPGVTNPDDSRNNLVVRGNSPVGVNWQIEGISSINPNHFATAGNSGGGINLLNPYTLQNIDFYTGAFPAAYGNALSAVIDVSLRNGNAHQREFHVRTSLVDIEAAVEGPISTKKRSSYLAAYRRFNLDIAQKISTLFSSYVSSIPDVQDFTFKLNFPHAKGATSVYGIGGISHLQFRNSLQAEVQTLMSSKAGVLGVNHFHVLDSKTYLKAHLAVSGIQAKNGWSDPKLSSNNKYLQKNLTIGEQKIAAHALINRKIKAGSSIRFGILGNLLRATSLKYIQAPYYRLNRTPEFLLSYGQLQSYFQWIWRPSSRLQIQSGFHTIFLTLNQAFQIEPRFRLSWSLSPQSTLGLSVSKQSQVPPSSLYLTGTYFFFSQKLHIIFPNKELGLSKSNQMVLTYRITPLPNFFIKLEGYYLAHYDIPDFNDSRQPLSFSGLNLGYDFGDDFQWITAPIYNTGTGRSYGLELTAEKSWNRSTYLLATASLYESKYTASDEIERNTAFNGNYTYNLLLGKEWPLGQVKKSLLTVNLSFSGAGGRRYTPIGGNIHSAGDPLIFSAQYKAYFRSDFKLGIQHNFNRFSQEISLDIRNVFNTQNVLYHEYVGRAPQFVEYYQMGFLPLLTYQIDF